jgi:hypothetical protein
VYRIFREKYAIDRQSADDQVLFEMTESFVFQPDLSKPGSRSVVKLSTVLPIHA